MTLQGHVQNGQIVADGGISWPEGTRVTISMPTPSPPSADVISESERLRYFDALSRIDAIADENPCDDTRGAYHDRALYGAEQ